VRVTHPFHPLSGQSFPRAGEQRSHHGDCVWLMASDGRTFSVPKRWTSESTPDAFDQFSQGRTHFRFDDLVDLAALMDGLEVADATDETTNDV